MEEPIKNPLYNPKLAEAQEKFVSELLMRLRPVFVPILDWLASKLKK